MRGDAKSTRLRRVRNTRLRLAYLASTPVVALIVGDASPHGAVAQLGNVAQLPPPPANGEMGFVVSNMPPAVIQEKTACPGGLTPDVRQIFLDSLPPAERARLLDPANQAEFDIRWRASVFGPDGSNICSHPDRFEDRPLLKTVQSSLAWGLDLDGDEGDGSGNPEGCAHENFVTPAGERGIDNQAYRVLGCQKTWRGTDGVAGDLARGLSQFFASGEFTQVILLRDVDNLVNDDHVEVIYGNTADRPVVDGTGKFIPGASFNISTTPPRHRNALRGRIVNGVLTTDPADIKLTQTWGQGRPRDIRGRRTKWDLRKARLRLTFQPDGTLKGLVGGYEPLWNLFQSSSIGGAGAAIDGGLDCAGALKTLKKYADGLRDPETGRCTAISTAYEVSAVPAFVNDVPGKVASN